MITPEQHIEIENYLNGKLSGAELEQFSAKMVADKLFKDEVEFTRLANEMVVSGEQLKLKQQLQEIHATHKKTKSTKGWKLGGALLLVGIVLTLFVVNNDETELEISKDVLVEAEQEAKIKDEMETEELDRFVQERVAESGLEESELGENTLSLEESEQEKEDSVDNYLNSLFLTDDSSPNTNGNEPGNEVSTKLEKSEPKAAASIETPKMDPCKLVKKASINFALTHPCISDKSGKIRFHSSSQDEVKFTEFSVDGGKTFRSEFEERTLFAGQHLLVAKNEDGCLSKAQKIEVKYGKCNYVIQPRRSKYWKLELPQFESDNLQLIIRNARTGNVVYNDKLDHVSSFVWQGTTTDNQELPMGNYVYQFVTTKKGLIATGQLTIIK